MNTKIEGLILSKTQFRDRDLICSCLLRSGQKVSVQFFGGRGGGKKQKGHMLEIGSLQKIDLRANRSQKGEGFYLAKEWTPTWFHEKIRSDYSAFSVLCFFLDLINKVAVTGNLQWDDGLESEHEGLFRVLSNGVFHLDRSLIEKSFKAETHLFLFLSKLCFELGVAPDLKRSVFMEEDLFCADNFVLSPEHGGFVLKEAKPDLREHNPGKEIHSLLGQIWTLSYAEFEKLPPPSREMVRAMFFYLCYQFQIEGQAMKTAQFFL